MEKIRTCPQCKTNFDRLAPGETQYFFGREFCSETCLTEFQRPVVGKAATYNIGSDYYPYTIVVVSPTGAKLTVRADRTVGKGALHIPAADAEVEYAYLTQRGTYNLGRSGRLYIGVRQLKLDPEF